MTLSERSHPLLRYGFAIACVAAAMAVRAILWPVLGASHPFLLTIVAVAIAAALAGTGPGIAAAVLGGILGLVFFLEPLFSPALRNIREAYAIGLYGAVVALLIWGNSRWRQTVRQAEEGKRKHRLLIDAVDEYAIFTLDAEGNVIDWNTGAERIKGYRAEEIVGHHMSELYLPEEAAEASEHLQQAKAHGTWRGEGWRIRKDGSRFWSEDSITAVRDPDGEVLGFTKITRDLSERRRTEQERERLHNELAEERARLRAILDQLPAGVVVAESPSGRLSLSNRLAVRLLGESLGAGGRAAFRALHPDGAPYSEEEHPIARALNRMEEIHGEEMQYRVNGGSISLSINAAPVRSPDGRVLAVVGTFEDITTRKRNEEQIRRLNEELRASNIKLEQRVLERTGDLDRERRFLQTILDTVDVGIVACDEQMRLTMINRTAGNWHRRSLDPVSYGDWAKEYGLHTPDGSRQLEWTEVPLYRALQEGELHDAEIMIAPEGGPRRNVLTNGRRIEGERGETLGAVVSMHDITPRLEVERALAQANEQLEAFAYTAAHDLRAPLRTIQAFSEALVQDYGSQLDSGARDFLSRIDAAIRRMSDLIRDLLIYSQLSRAGIQIERVPLDVAVSGALKQQEGTIKETAAAVSTDVPRFTVRGNRLILTQALENLLSNSLKFVRPGDRPQIEISAGRVPGRRVRVEVRDHGIGIPPEYHKRIFDPFQRLHGVDHYAGTGIGLSIVRKGIERSGGTVGVESTPGEGSRFWIELPEAE